jgi:hypothetical protein
MEQIMTVVSRWPRDYSQKDIAHEANLGAGATHTIVDWCSFCQSKTVKIDKSKFFHRKYHRGQRRGGHWVFRGIERESSNCFLVEVPDRIRETVTIIGVEQYIC